MLPLKKVIAKTFSLASDQGVAFYLSPKISNLTEFQGLYRRRRDELPSSESQQREVADEANSSFSMNLRFFAELERRRDIDRALTLTIDERRTETHSCR